MGYFPFFIDLAGRAGLVVGGGSTALRKLEKLKPYGPALTAAALVCAVIAYWDGLTKVRGSVKGKLSRSDYDDEYDDYEE